MSIPTRQEIRSALYGAATMTMKDDGVEVGFIFEKQADAIVTLLKDAAAADDRIAKLRNVLSPFKNLAQLNINCFSETGDGGDLGYANDLLPLMATESKNILDNKLIDGLMKALDALDN